MNTIHECPLLELKRSNKSPITNKGIDFLIEQIKDSDEYEWPPEQENRYVYWQPAMLEENSFELLKIHKLVILKNLERRMGCFAEINLWEWYWKQVVSNYFKDLRTELPFDIRPGSELEDYDGIEYLKLLSKSLSGGVDGTTEELEKHQIRLGQGNLSDAEYSRLLHLRNLSQIQDKARQNILCRRELK